MGTAGKSFGQTLVCVIFVAAIPCQRHCRLGVGMRSAQIHVSYFTNETFKNAVE